MSDPLLNLPGYDPDNPASETYLPISVLHRRFENHRDEMKRVRDKLPRREFIRRAMLKGVINTYEFEIEALEQIGGATVLARMGIRSKGLGE